MDYETYSQYAESQLTNISNDPANPMRVYGETNLHIIQRLKKKVLLTGDLVQALAQSRPMIFLVLTEGYCGDSAQNLAVIGKMQEMFPQKVEVKIILRDKHLDIADHCFHTRAIPTLICLEKETLKENFIWGNRPKPAQQIMDDLKAKKASQEEKSVAWHRWYAFDGTLTLQRELMELIRRS